MKTMTFSRVGYTYLLLVPVLASLVGFGIGHVSNFIYLPVWAINAFLMIYFSLKTGWNSQSDSRPLLNNLQRSAFLLIFPWILISMFAGLGPPPDTAAEWTATATEQQVRYFMLVICGFLLLLGLAGLTSILMSQGEYVCSAIARLAIQVAIPLFIINMLYWGFYLTELFKMMNVHNASGFPDWFLPVRQLVGVISAVEVALTYLATFFIVFSMKKSGLMNNLSVYFYLFFSLLAFLIILLSVFFTELLYIPGFAVSIPAAPFLMPYFIGVNLLKKSNELNKRLLANRVQAAF